MNFQRWRLRSLTCVTVFVFATIAAAQSEPDLKTVDDRLAEFGEVVRARLEPLFATAGVLYPPEHLTFVGLKEERVLEVYASSGAAPARFICTYPVLAASGGPGPKLREGDRQVPEGVYCLRELNPNSKYHLSLWIDYPNAVDLARALADGRMEPGGEIMIHGGVVSRGCLALGDPAAEDLFVLAALTGVENVTVILAPFDFRQRSLGALPEGAPEWTDEVYAEINRALAGLPAVEKTGLATD